MSDVAASHRLPEVMTVVEAVRPGGPEVLATATRPVPVPGPGEVLVRLRAAALAGSRPANHDLDAIALADQLIRAGEFDVVVAGEAEDVAHRLAARVKPAVFVLVVDPLDLQLRDPLGDLNLGEDDYDWVTGRLVDIAGVAVAIYLGGPGAVFWMWMVALVGMATAYAESTLAQLYKVPGDHGLYRGGVLPQAGYFAFFRF